MSTFSCWKAQPLLDATDLRGKKGPIQQFERLDGRVSA